MTKSRALTAVLSAFPADLAVPTLIVQHMPPMFTRLLAERLSAQTTLYLDDAFERVSIGRSSCYQLKA